MRVHSGSTLAVLPNLMVQDRVWGWRPQEPAHAPQRRQKCMGVRPQQSPGLAQIPQTTIQNLSFIDALQTPADVSIKEAAWDAVHGNSQARSSSAVSPTQYGDVASLHLVHKLQLRLKHCFFTCTMTWTGAPCNLFSIAYASLPQFAFSGLRPLQLLSSCLVDCA